MKNRQLVIFGARNFAQLAHYYFKHDSDYAVRAFVVDEDYLSESSYDGLPVTASSQLTTDFPPSDYDVFVAIGYGRVNRQRAEKLAEITALGYSAASFVSTKASVAADVVVRPNTMIMEYSVIHPNVQLGENTMLFPRSVIALKTRVGDHCWIVCATVDEAVQLGDYSFVGLSSAVGPNVVLGESCIVGAGAVVLSDIGSHTVVRPAKCDKRPMPERMRRVFGVNPPGS